MSIFVSRVCYFTALCTWLSFIVQERPQLEAQRSELLESITSDLQFLRDLEDKCLGLLQKSEGKLPWQHVIRLLQKSEGRLPWQHAIGLLHQQEHKKPHDNMPLDGA